MLPRPQRQRALFQRFVQDISHYYTHSKDKYHIGTLATLFLSKKTFKILFQVKARLEKMGPYAPMNIFLRQELDRMQRVISAVRETLTDLKLAIDGTIIMSEVRSHTTCQQRGLFRRSSTNRNIIVILPTCYPAVTLC